MTKTFNLTVGPRPDVITFTQSGTVTVGQSGTLNATSRSGQGFIYLTSLTNDVCSVKGNVATAIKAGQCGIQARETVTPSGWAEATPVKSYFTVVNAKDTITMAPVPASIHIFDNVTVSAASASKTPVLLIAAGNGPCSVSGSVISANMAGDCSVSARVATEPNGWDPGDPVSVTMKILDNVADQITVASIPTSYKVGATATVSAAATSKAVVQFSVDSSSGGSCALSGSTVSMVKAGTCKITASLPKASVGYNQALPVSLSLSIAAATVTDQITFASIPTSYKVGATATVSATATSKAQVQLSIDTSSGGSCSLSGTTVSMVKAGTCKVNASALTPPAGYDQAAPASLSLTITAPAAADQISFTSIPVSYKVGATATVSATATSKASVQLSIDTSSGGSCSLSGTTISMVKVGTCKINASVPTPPAGYDQAAPASLSLTITAPAAADKISFTSMPMSYKVGATATVSATAISKAAVQFSIDASSGGSCSLSGTTVSMVKAGTCNINATVPTPPPGYDPAPPASLSLTITAPAVADQITVGNYAATLAVGKTQILSASATSKATIQFSVAPSSSGFCSIAGNVLSILKKGLCAVTASAAAPPAGYTQAQSVSLTITGI
jgi:hypothetical protein